MGKVATGFSTSLDGFIAGPDGDVGPLFDWYFAGGASVGPRKMSEVTESDSVPKAFWSPLPSPLTTNCMTPR